MFLHPKSSQSLPRIFVHIHYICIPTDLPHFHYSFSNTRNSLCPSTHISPSQFHTMRHTSPPAFLAMSVTRTIRASSPGLRLKKSEATSRGLPASVRRYLPESRCHSMILALPVVPSIPIVAQATAGDRESSEWRMSWLPTSTKGCPAFQKSDWLESFDTEIYSAWLYRERWGKIRTRILAHSRILRLCW